LSSTIGRVGAPWWDICCRRHHRYLDGDVRRVHHYDRYDLRGCYCGFLDLREKTSSRNERKA
jgi:hypothetical protein